MSSNKTINKTINRYWQKQFRNESFSFGRALNASRFLVLFSVKKYLLVGASGMLWTGGSVSGSVDQ